MRRMVFRLFALAALFAASASQAAAGGAAHVRGKTAPAAPKAIEVTPVEGDSWLRHIGLPFVASNMGRAGRWGAMPSKDVDPPPWPEHPRDEFLVSGSDLYRFNCRSCHTSDGSGLPPEINSLIGPVQATSPVTVRAQMKQRGIDLDARSVDLLVAQARAAIRTRLQNGGERMPSFRHLTPEEIEALTAYLEKLAGIPGADLRQKWILEPAARVGEHLVKGTCHICHEANGAGLAVAVGTTQAIPSLTDVSRDRSESEVIRKVMQGVSKPNPMMTSDRGQMPIFDDLKPLEIAAAYRYLLIYPPRR